MKEKKFNAETSYYTGVVDDIDKSGDIVWDEDHPRKSFKGAAVIEEGCKTSTDFFTKNPFLLRKGVKYNLYAVDDEKGELIYFDECEFGNSEDKREDYTSLNGFLEETKVEKEQLAEQNERLRNEVQAKEREIYSLKSDLTFRDMTIESLENKIKDMENSGVGNSSLFQGMLKEEQKKNAELLKQINENNKQHLEEVQRLQQELHNEKTNARVAASELSGFKERKELEDKMFDKYQATLSGYEEKQEERQAARFDGIMSMATSFAPYIGPAIGEGLKKIIGTQGKNETPVQPPIMPDAPTAQATDEGDAGGELEDDFNEEDVPKVDIFQKIKGK